MKAITTRFLGCTTLRGSRYSATDGDNRIYLSADDALSSEANHDAAATAFCAMRKWKGTLLRGSIKNENVYVWDSPAERITV